MNNRSLLLFSTYTISLPSGEIDDANLSQRLVTTGAFDALPSIGRRWRS
jgi:hypothetical protein